MSRDNTLGQGITYVVIQDCRTTTDQRALERLARGDEVPTDQRGIRALSVGDRIKAGELPDVTLRSLLDNRCIAPRGEADAASAALMAEYGPERIVTADGGSYVVGVRPLSERAAALFEVAINEAAADTLPDTQISEVAATVEPAALEVVA